MALDVHLTRDVNERWGFELLNGAVDEMPLTIQKLEPSSPAARAGLQNGDTILFVNNEEAIDFTQEEASRKLADCGDTLNIAVMRGLYDPVLDDTEPLYYEPGDLDPESRPTEVPFKIQQFLEPADLGSSLLDYGNTNGPSDSPFDPSVLLPENRSLTASPYFNPSKPYRPFSTEPVPEVPSLEDPIILNPDYKDQFGESPEDINPDYILKAHYGNENVEPKYKLPISEQYDPDGNRKVKNDEVESILSKYVNMEMLSKKTVTTSEKITKTSKKGVKVTRKSSKDVKNVAKDSRKSVVKDVISKESLSKDVKEQKDSLKEIKEDIHITETSKQEKSLKKDVKIIEQYGTVTKDKEEEIINEELKYIEKMKHEIDIDQIEQTALSVVEDSIERAVSVAEEIKKEIDEELTSEAKERSKSQVTESEKKVVSKKSGMETKESTELIESESKKISEEFVSDSTDRRVSKDERYEDIQQKVLKQDFRAEDQCQEADKKATKEAFESKTYVSEEYEEKAISRTPPRKESYKHDEIHSESAFENKREFKKLTKTDTSGIKSDKSEAQQRTYAVGLQTIPNIRGVVQSSYHYDLLLRTFFIHLTDVMVALSRFVLTQPVFNTESRESRENVSQTQMYESGVKDVKKSEHEFVESVRKVERQQFEDSKRKVDAKKEHIIEERKEVIKPVYVQEKKQEIKSVTQKAEDVKVQEKKFERRQLVTPVSVEEIKIEKAEAEQIQKKEEALAVAKVEEKKTISGAQMAQRTEKKLTKEMTQKLDAVISEFQTIAIEEDTKEMFQRRRRSRSRSQIEEEVAKESDPLEWLAKVDSRRASQEISEERLSKKEFSSSGTFERKHFETTERQEIRHKKTKTPKQMYRAIVEAHVYTNKDVIFEDASEFSETSSVQSAEEINTAFESVETTSTENVMLQSAMQQLEQAQIVEEAREMLKAEARSEATIRKLEEVVHESTDIKHEEVKKETAIQSTDKQEVIIQETREIIEPIFEIKEEIKKESVAVDINESLSIAESSEINILDSKSEFTSVESKKESLAAIKSTDVKEVAIQETTEIFEPIVEIKEEIKKENVAVDINESLSIAESSEINILESKSEFAGVETKKESLAAIQSTDVQEVIIQETTEIIEPVIEIKEEIKKESVAVDINESLSIAESSEINIHESKSDFTSVESETESLTAIQATDVQEVVIQETREIIEPVIEIKEEIKKESIAIDINESLSIAQSSEINILESKSEFTALESKTESVAIVEEIDESAEVIASTQKVEVMEAKAEIEEQVQIEEVTEKVVVKPYRREDEYAALKIVKEVETEATSPTEIVEVEEAVVKKIAIKELHLDLSKAQEEQSEVAIISTADVGVEILEYPMDSKTEPSSKHIGLSSMSMQKYQSESHVSQELVQEASCMARFVTKESSMRTDLQKQDSVPSTPPSSIDTPTPSSVPPTPLTEEYVFKFTVPLPKDVTPVPRDCSVSPIDEDPQIVKKKLIPHIETNIEEKVIYDPPLPTPPGDKILSPIFKTPGLFGGESKPIYKIGFPPNFIYRKPGLFGGADNPEFTKEEIREIERKSSLLASAIDETIKSIEEYKEEVGMEKSKDLKVKEFKEEKVSKSYQESYSKKVVIESSKQNGVESTIKEEIIEKNGDVARNKDNDVKIVEVVKENTKFESTDKANVKEEATKQTEVEKKIEISNKETMEKEKVEVANNQVVKEETNIEIEKKENVKEETNVEIEKKEVVQEEIHDKTQNKDTSKTNAQKDSAETTSITKIEVQVESKSENAIEEKPKREEPPIEEASKEIDKSETTITEVEETENQSETSVEDETECETEISEVKEEKRDPMEGYRPVVFEPNAVPKREIPSVVIQLPSTQEGRQSPYITDSGEIMGTIQGIVDGLEEPVIDPEIAKELGKPGISEEKIAELISGEAEMLREAHVMGLSRVLTSHMHRTDDSVDFQKIKPMLDSLKDSEVLKALNEDLARQMEEQKKKEEKKWTTFLQKPKRPVPKAKFGYHGWTEAEQALVSEPYTVKIVKQAKPKVAPDYKPEDFETGPLPWEERAEFESSLPPVEPEEPILIPEVPEYLEAVDPTKESEVPDLEDTGLPLPPPRQPTPPPLVIEQPPEERPAELQEPEVQEVEPVYEEEQKEIQEDMDNRLAEQVVRSVQSMVDPNAGVEQQLSQMRAQLAALAQLPEVIQQTLELVSKQLNKMSHQGAQVSMSASHQESHNYQSVEVTQNHTGSMQEGIVTEQNEMPVMNHQATQQNDSEKVMITEMEDKMESGGQMPLQENMAEQLNQMQQERERQLQTPLMMQQESRGPTPITEEEMRMDKMRKAQQHQSKLEADARQIKQRSTPRSTKPKRMFGPLDPDSRPVVLPGGRRWRTIDDVYDEQKIAETLQAHSELIQGKAMGFESELLPFDDRINFMKYEKPPVTLDHLQNSETYKLVHDMDQPPHKRVELLTPVISEADYREPSSRSMYQLKVKRCASMEGDAAL